jgi:GNAT superfamily N-acetyltransferase
MDALIVEEPIENLVGHARVPIAFVVDRILSVTVPERGLGGISLAETMVASPWVKDYDAIEGEGPTRWASRFDVSRWGLIAAYDGARRVGGAVIAVDTPDLVMLDGRADLAVLWDLRVHPDVRGCGIGRALFAATEAWCAARGRRTLKIETQKVNVAACRFYARMGCTLGAIDRWAYAELPGEVQLLWFKDLAAPDDGVGTTRREVREVRDPG